MRAFKLHCHVLFSDLFDKNCCALLSPLFAHDILDFVFFLVFFPILGLLIAETKVNRPQ